MRDAVRNHRRRDGVAAGRLNRATAVVLCCPVLGFAITCAKQVECEYRGWQPTIC